MKIRVRIPIAHTVLHTSCTCCMPLFFCWCRVVQNCVYNFFQISCFQSDDAQRREKNIEEAKKILIKMDPLLPEAKLVSTPSSESHRTLLSSTEKCLKNERLT